MDEQIKTKQLPLLVLRDKVMMPNVSASFEVNKLKSLSALGKSIDYENYVFIVFDFTNFESSETAFENQLGVVCRVKRVSQLAGSNIRVTVDTLYRAKALETCDNGDHITATVTEMPDMEDGGEEEKNYLAVVKARVLEYAYTNPKIPREAVDNLRNIENPSEFVNVATHFLPVKDDLKKEIFEETIVIERLKLLIASVLALIEFAAIDKRITDTVKESIDKSQREYYLREQIKAVHKELGDDEDEIETLRTAIIDKKMPEEVEKKALKELQRMSRMSSSSPDYTVLRTYIDALIELPFNETTVDRSDFNEVVKILDKDHFGLQKVKDRIIEYVAVLKATGKIPSTILCLVGPPGVGKTSVAISIAHALDRKFVRMSLGGVKDEAEIRGHRKTYIGAMPGRIITGIKNAGVSNPVFLLDEIDKISMDLRGDPASALLEVLDPEQNDTFRDRYMEIPYDLSKVLFITTANTLDTIPRPLLDRMEVIELDGYTLEEKVEIASRYLVPKREKINGLSEKNVEFTQDALSLIADGYTKEAGVRNLERKIDAVCRKLVTEFEKSGKFGKRKISGKTLKNYLGSPKYFADEAEKEDMLGVANGLAWTQYGGTTLSIEVCVSEGKGELILTGKLGDVMKESARTALTYVETHAKELGITDDKFSEKTVHVHVPEGATPKDGPSAGVTLATAMLSAFTGKKVRKDVAMTGEITLRGNVLPIGGLKEKSLASFRTGVYNIIMPKANQKDIEDIPENIREKLNFIPVENATEVFKNAFVNF